MCCSSGTPLKIVLNARVLAKDKGTPLLRNGIRSIAIEGADEDEVSEQVCLLIYLLISELLSMLRRVMKPVVEKLNKRISIAETFQDRADRVKRKWSMARITAQDNLPIVCGLKTISHARCLKVHTTYRLLIMYMQIIMSD